MKFTIETSTPQADTKQIVSADSRQQTQAILMQESPDMEWVAYEGSDKLVGKKYRPDGTGTDKIIIVTPL